MNGFRTVLLTEDEISTDFQFLSIAYGDVTKLLSGSFVQIKI